MINSLVLKYVLERILVKILAQCKEKRINHMCWYSLSYSLFAKSEANLKTSKGNFNKSVIKIIQQTRRKLNL